MKQREIKFRAWDKENQEMITFWQDLEDNFTVNSKNELLFMIESGKPLILQQYTGLKDKNGKEIFEGDIVKHHTIIPFSKEGRKATKREIGLWIIGWDNCRYKLEPIGSGKKHTLHPQEYLFEIIGNIYENPELLKQTINI